MARILTARGTGFIGANLVQHCPDRSDDAMNADFLPPRHTRQSIAGGDTDLLKGKIPVGCRAKSDHLLTLVRSLEGRQGSAPAAFAPSM